MNLIAGIIGFVLCFIGGTFLGLNGFNWKLIVGLLLVIIGVVSIFFFGGALC